MDKVKRFFELKKLWIKSNESERAELDKEIKGLLAAFTEEDSTRLAQEISTHSIDNGSC